MNTDTASLLFGQELQMAVVLRPESCRLKGCPAGILTPGRFVRYRPAIYIRVASSKTFGGMDWGGAVQYRRDGAARA